ncbi:four helix bundle protein [Rhodohalobacter sp. 614A]|uniref:four helix bundle protein n=1 Tax=Rhodohalobacter sp. 614A TaxID=2908649 RepID=UPI002105B286|nr:four helix bundle protein [Rhodohalobacter sp. 614A]
MYGIVSQMRRSVVSISSNIAEGAGRQSKKEFKRFLNISKGSSYELETQLTISKNLGFIKQDQFEEIIQSLVELHKMIHALIKTLNKN